MVKRNTNINVRGATRQSVKSSKKFTKLPTQPFSIKRYFRQHKEILKESFTRLLASPLSSFMTLMVIAIALSLPSGLYVVLKNVQSVTDQWEKTSIISLYLFPEIDDTDALAISQQLSKRADVDSVKLISKEDGLQYFQQASGYEQILSSLPENPLPVVLQVIPKQKVDLSTLASLEKLRDELGSLQRVEYAELDAEWLQRLASFLNFGKRFIYALSALLIVAVLFIVGNTIRMAVESRQDEVLVMKLIGATDSYIRRPFLYMGFWFGIIGGLFAILCLLIVSFWINGPAEELIELYHSDFELRSLGFNEVLISLLISAVIGVLGSWIAVNRHISEIELQL